MKIFIIVLLAVLLLLALWTLYGYFSIRSIEKPAYTVVAQKAGYEIRSYDAYLVAETTVSGTMQEALNAGFRIIADYIFGNNTARTSIAMTAPVGERDAGSSEKIAMTVPVSESEVGNDTRVISFVMPSMYTQDTLPVPNDARVHIREVPQRTVAVLTFSWSTSEQTVARKKEELLALLVKDGASISGVAETAFYNPPWTPPFMLHSEILVPMTK